MIWNPWEICSARSSPTIFLSAMKRKILVRSGARIPTSEKPRSLNVQNQCHWSWLTVICKCQIIYKIVVQYEVAEKYLVTHLSTIPKTSSAFFHHRASSPGLRNWKWISLGKVMIVIEDRSLGGDSSTSSHDHFLINNWTNKYRLHWTW